MFIRLLAFALFVAALAGCGASIDSQGNVMTDRVWFDQAGTAHCPHPDCTPPEAKEGKLGLKLKPTDKETDASLVMVHSNVCVNGHPVTWAPDEVICWACQGSRICPTCRGTGAVGKDHGKELVCAMCLSTDTESRVGTGICAECGGKGTIRHGGSGTKTDPVTGKEVRHDY